MSLEPIRCPACHSTRQSEPLERYRQWSLYECLECGVQHFWPAKNPGADWYQENEMYAARDLMVVDWLGWYHRAALDNMPVRSGSVIDVGCGNGAFVAAAAERGYEAWGIDFSSKAIEAGRRHFRLQNLYAMRIEDFTTQFGDRRFDVVTAFEVLEHMDDASAFVLELSKVLKPGGHLIVSVPNRERRPWLLNEGDLPPHHFTRWNVPAIHGFLARHEFTRSKVIVCPTRITLKAFILYRIHLGLVIRLTRRAQADHPGAIQRTAMLARARTLTILKDRLADLAAVVLAPVLAPFVRGPMLVAIAQRAEVTNTAAQDD
ncbi:MAG: methyltransferase domain-containing protein [Chloroflexi bacterium]|nr:MAG: methyltransferase domain-containing protein [Chloroflexota bacterium]